MNYITQKDGSSVPALGQGTWQMGDIPENKKTEIAALRRGIDLGMTLIDTAEMYGSGRSERLVGEAIKPCDRKSLYIVTKVLPQNAGRQNILSSCERSLRNLATDYIDCYLLHWRSTVPIAETVDCMLELRERGYIKSFGVSNFDTDDIKQLLSCDGGDECVTDQVLYHLGSRGIEYDLLPFLSENDISVMAYCPLAQAGRLRRTLTDSGSVKSVAEKHGADVFQILLAFVLAQNNVIAIPKAASEKHVDSNFGATKIKLDADDMVLLSRDFPAPAKKMPLDIE